MTLFVFGLVFLSASLHVLWNTLVKTSEDKTSFSWLTTMLGCVAILPFFLIARVTAPGNLGPEIWGLAALSGFLSSVYIVLLFKAYGHADLSVVYPLSRGVAPVLTMLLGGRLLGDWVTLEQAASVMVIVGGVFLVSHSARRRGVAGNGYLIGVALAIATGAAIAGYHLVDRRAMKLSYPPNIVEYLFLVHLFMALSVSGWVFLVFRKGRSAWSEWRKNTKSIIIVGICTPLTYFLIAWALKFGNVTYVTACRNIGIFVSTLVGSLFLREKVNSCRLSGAVFIVLGVIALVFLEG